MQPIPAPNLATSTKLTPSTQSIDDMLSTLTNPRWTDANQDPTRTPVTFDCVNLGVKGTFVAHPNDPEPHGAETWEKAIAGDYGVIGPYAAPVETVEQKMSRVTGEAQDYFQSAIPQLPPGPDRQQVHTEMQSAFTANGTYMAQIPPPWDRPVTAQDNVYFDQGQAAINETIDYLNSLGTLSKRLPPFKEK